MKFLGTNTPLAKATQIVLHKAEPWGDHHGTSHTNTPAERKDRIPPKQVPLTSMVTYSPHSLTRRHRLFPERPLVHWPIRAPPAFSWALVCTCHDGLYVEPYMMRKLIVVLVHCAPQLPPLFSILRSACSASVKSELIRQIPAAWRAGRGKTGFHLLKRPTACDRQAEAHYF